MANPIEVSQVMNLTPVEGNIDIEQTTRRYSFRRAAGLTSFALATGLGVGVATEAFDGDAPEVYAEGCFVKDPVNGTESWYDPCPGSEPAPTTVPVPVTTTPPSSGGGGNNGGGNSGGGSSSGGGGSQPVVTSAPKPSYEDKLAFIGCEDDKGNPNLAAELEELKAEDGSGRIITLIDWCELEFIEEDGIMEGYGRPNTNWEDLIANPDFDITPNEAQTNALNIYLLNRWNELNPPETTSTTTSTTSSTTSTTTTTTTVAPTSTTSAAPATTENILVDTTSTPETTENELLITIPETTTAVDLGLEPEAPDTTVVVAETEVQEAVEESVQTTDADIAIIASDNDSEKGSGTNWLIPAAGVAAAAASGLILVAAVRRRRDEEDRHTLPHGSSPIA